MFKLPGSRNPSKAVKESTINKQTTKAPILEMNTTLNREFHAVQNGRIPLFTSATVRIHDIIRISTSGNSYKFISFTAN